MIFGSKDNQEAESKPQRRNTFSFRHKASTSRSATATSDERKSSGTQSSFAVRNSFIAGLTAGVTGTLVGHPLDSVKVWLQTGQRPNFASGNVSAMGVLSALRRSYAGVASPVLTVGLIQSINFAAYDSMRRFWYYTFEDPHGDPVNKRYLNSDSFTSISVSGIAAGAVVSVITQPVMMIKTKQQTQNVAFKQAIRHSLRHPLVGFGTHFFVETANRSIYFVTYEALKRKYTNQDGNTSITTRMMSAMAAGIACWIFIYPTDVIRSRLYSLSAADRHMRASEVVRLMHAEQGWKSFFRGFTVTTLRAGPVAAVILPVYDIVLDQLNKLPF